MISKAALEAFKNIETPFYYYDMELLRATLEECRSQAAKYGYKVHYAIKANDQQRIVDTVCSYGFGVDCVSGGEIELAVKSGFDPSKIVFAGVAKTDAEIRLALKAGIGCFNCESIPEIERIDEIAGEMGLRANIAIRVNPDIDAHTHKYISTGLEENKFGISIRAFGTVVETLSAVKNIEFRGLHVHVGSQITEMSVFALACKRTVDLMHRFERAGFPVKSINLGGGLGVDYQHPVANPMPQFDAWFATVHENLPLEPGQELHFEPGRSLVAQCGDLISRAVYVKQGIDRKFVILDAGMNDLIRPALYQAYHDVENLTSDGQLQRYDVAGPVCESSDSWGEGLMVAEAHRGDLFAIHSAGAYGQVMAMPYNRRPFAKAYYSDELLK
ncbi:MAG: diaminopimelate decarboxylase [Bacteroidales bacterium]|nr:diaminopimelate decarboxylase [Bacteroidales bacterium]